MDKNKFLELLVGDGWIPDGSGKSILEDPLPVIRWMGKNMPEVLDSYIGWCILQCKNRVKGSETVFFILDLSNLVAYLKEHREEWGVKECMVCQSTGEGEANKCRYCNGTGKIKHPALIYLEQEEAKDE